jgi:hypothetical protein
MFSHVESIVFHIVAAVTSLTLGFIVVGFLESLLLFGNLKLLYYYGCVGNSCIYIFFCTAFSILISWRYALKHIQLNSQDTISNELNELGTDSKQT